MRVRSELGCQYSLKKKIFFFILNSIVFTMLSTYENTCIYYVIERSTSIKSDRHRITIICQEPNKYKIKKRSQKFIISFREGVRFARHIEADAYHVIWQKNKYKIGILRIICHREKNIRAVITICCSIDSFN